MKIDASFFWWHVIKDRLLAWRRSKMKEKYFIAYSNVVNITIKSKAILNALRYVTTMFFCLFTCIFLTDQTFICQNTIFIFACLHIPMYASCFQKNPCSKWLHIFVGDLILSYVIHCNLRVIECILQYIKIKYI